MKIRTYRALTENQWLNLFDIDYIDKSGAQRSWQVASRASRPKCVAGGYEAPDAVLMVPYHRTRRQLVVIREYRVSLADYQIEFPAGLVDEDETVEQAARRELKEETGLELVRLSARSPVLYNTAGLTDESVCMVFCECDGDPSSAGNEGSEDIAVQLLTPAEARALLMDETFRWDAKCWIILSRFAATGHTV